MSSNLDPPHDGVIYSLYKQARRLHSWGGECARNVPEKQSVNTDEMGVASIANTKKHAPQVVEPSGGNKCCPAQVLATKTTH